MQVREVLFYNIVATTTVPVAGAQMFNWSVVFVLPQHNVSRESSKLKKNPSGNLNKRVSRSFGGQKKKTLFHPLSPNWTINREIKLKLWWFVVGLVWMMTNHKYCNKKQIQHSKEENYNIFE